MVAVMAAAALGSCRPGRTQLLVVLDTDIPDCRLSDIHLRCAYNWDPSMGEPTSLTCDYPFHRGQSSATIRLPGSFGVTANEMILDQPVTLVIDDSNPGVTPPLRRIVSVNFVPHETRQLVVRLTAACAASAPVSATHPCAAGQTSCTLSQSCEAQGMTCGNEGTCRSIVVPASELESGDAGLPDSGASDASSCG